MCRGGSEPLRQWRITAPRHWDSSLPPEPKGSRERRGREISCRREADGEEGEKQAGEEMMEGAGQQIRGKLKK